jgi:hypothetical protein
LLSLTHILEVGVEVTTRINRDVKENKSGVGKALGLRPRKDHQMRQSHERHSRRKGKVQRPCGEHVRGTEKRCLLLENASKGTQRLGHKRPNWFTLKALNSVRRFSSSLSMAMGSARTFKRSHWLLVEHYPLEVLLEAECVLRGH